MQPVRVLVVDDETTLAELLSMALRYEGWEVRSAGDGRGALRLAREFRPDAVVLDIMLPDMDGLEVLRRLRAESPDVPVLFLTARDAVEDRVAGLTAGGDDYVTKPFSLEELVARLRGLMRRAARTTEALQGARLVVGDLTMDEESREVARGGVPVHLTATEFELLRFFMRNPRRVLSKAQILDRVWNYDFGGQANVVELYVSYLRKKIDAGRPPMIHTMRGAGYVLRPAEADHPAARADGPSAMPRSATARAGAFGTAAGAGAGSATAVPGAGAAGVMQSRADLGRAAQLAPEATETGRPNRSGGPGGGHWRTRRS
ncbi:response regulator with CheY-like receiver domain and winged-helix DNA-binding domain [Frankia torreyi]|uniref:Response regulator with CheY-like receiver domain and winged-helix DNA-binding domain n=1 Tax=Frankia torreyi TaxID=1856 RepID=A0A0D8BDC2_9ACTN|nr:response regulator with CheY-like receiver domain and winged-helix DNA-binding domain [Frankia torreyi]KQM04038.1 response regulator with CheY-like receiver domain and winged-helix DNA-binding domain [Frankia sp. CpI1-P]